MAFIYLLPNLTETSKRLQVIVTGSHYSRQGWTKSKSHLLNYPPVPWGLEPILGLQPIPALWHCVQHDSPAMYFLSASDFITTSVQFFTFPSTAFTVTFVLIHNIQSCILLFRTSCEDDADDVCTPIIFAQASIKSCVLKCHNWPCFCSVISTTGVCWITKEG